MYIYVLWCEGCCTFLENSPGFALILIKIVLVRCRHRLFRIDKQIIYE
jgi:hypothetical protein